MSKASPFSPHRQHKRVERLYFPKYDDPSLHIEYGRKHFAQKVSYPVPYASNIDDSQYISQQKQKSINTQNLRQGRQSSLYHHAYPEDYGYEQTHGDRRSLQYQPKAANQVLQQQIYNFNQNKQYMTDRKIDNLIKIRPQRVQTEANYQKPKQPVRLELKIPSQLDRYTDTRNLRLNTQQSRPAALPSRARFNPTFLSSLNY